MTACTPLTFQKNFPAFSDKHPAHPLSHWAVRGAFALSMPDRSASLYANWKQVDPTHFTLRLFGPLGSHDVVLVGKPKQVTLFQSDGKTFTATSADALLRDILHWDLPINDLSYWIQGAAAPGQAASLQTDKQQQPRLLTQSGWEIRYEQFMPAPPYVLPKKLILYNARYHLKLKLMITHWDFK